jgi:antitoxin VapB
MVERKAVMPLSIKNEVTERLARQLAKETGESLTETIRHALEERLERLPGRRRGRIMAEKLEDILRRVDALPPLDTRPEDEILGYDKQGIPADGH